jgi:hypothetical protein
MNGEEAVLKVASFALIAALTGYCLYAVADSRIDVRPAVTPIGSSSSDGVSFAWFYDASNRNVYVCRAGKGVQEMLDCKARSALP